MADPFDSRRRHRALARFDLLDRERASGAITEAAYQAGRDAERVFEDLWKASGSGQWLERIGDGSTSAEMKIVLGLQRAQHVNEFLGWLVGQLGRRDTRLVWYVLGERLTLRLAALAFGRVGVRGYRYTADRFRDALELLAEAKAARGRALRR